MDFAPAPADPPVRLWLIEDDLVYQKSFLYVLGSVPGYQCTHTFFAYEELAEYLATEDWTPPDVVLMDIGLPGITGIEGVRRLKSHLPETPLIMLTDSDKSEHIQRSLIAGAFTYLLKDTAPDDMLLTIRKAREGKVHAFGQVLEEVMAMARTAPPPRPMLDKLTRRERQVLRWMVAGQTQREIAETLLLSPHTVDKHRRHIYQKLDVHSGRQAVALAIRERLL